MSTKSLQETYAPESICFGCGPKNPAGLHVQSFVDGDKIVATWRPKPEHHAFPGVLNGGIICAILDCHCNWASAYYLLKQQGLTGIPSTVTADFYVKLKRVTPMDTPLYLEAWLDELSGNKACIQGQLIANDKVCATAKGHFIAVDETHPAFHRWQHSE